MAMMIIDPPTGWRYGFPRPCPDFKTPGFDIRAWFIQNGYPEKDIMLAMHYSRYWEAE